MDSYLDPLFIMDLPPVLFLLLWIVFSSVEVLILKTNQLPQLFPEAFSQMNMYFAMCNMPIVPSQYWNQVHGLKPTDVEKDLEGLQTMRTLALNMSWLLKCIEAGKSNGIPLPQREEPIATNFIR